MSIPALFQPIQVGSNTLSHRVVLAPLTRVRANKQHVHYPIAAEYYAQRAIEPGTLLITEATFIAEKAGGMSNVPGIWNEEQIAAWKKVTDAVHEKDSFIYLQLWALGRAADPSLIPEDAYVSASDIGLSGKPPPRPLSIDEVQEYVQLYATAASNAVHNAGFDGVEIHGANGYLIDQFLQTNSNQRADQYGGSTENRARFALEVVEAVTKAVGQNRTGIRLSPWSRFQEMGMSYPLAVETFSHVVARFSEEYPDLAFIHVVEPGISGANAEANTTYPAKSNDIIRKIWSPRPLISAGGYTREKALEVAETKGDLIAFGKLFISNPDLVKRLREDIDLTPYERKTFFLSGDTSGLGYTDYSFASARL